MEHELILIGSRINHLPSAIFRLYSILQQGYPGQYEETGDSPLVYRKEDNVYTSERALMTPADATVRIAYAEIPESDRYTFTVRMVAVTGESYMLTIPCGKAFLQQYYYPVRRFVRTNPAKYVRPGTSTPPREGMMIAVLDTEMQRPYITQFSGCLLRYTNGAWTISEADRMNVYIRLPEGVKVDPYVCKVTGLTRAFLDANGVDEEDALDQITQFLSQAELVCGHAVLSDIELLRERYLLAGRIPDPSVLSDSAARDLAISTVSAGADEALASRLAGALRYQADEAARNDIPPCLLRSDLIDTQVLMEYLYDLSGMIKLERAAELAGVTEEGDVFHDARTDADVTARLLIRLWPEFVTRFGVMPIVKAAMMHAPKDTVILNPILGKFTTAGSGEGSKPRGKSSHERRSASKAGRAVKRSVRSEQHRRNRIT